MSTVQTKDDFEIYYKDWGKGQPIAGQPDAVLSHDRRDHGRSSQVPDGLSRVGVDLGSPVLLG